jgi:hypothetical protein
MNLSKSLRKELRQNVFRNKAFIQAQDQVNNLQISWNAFSRIFTDVQVQVATRLLDARMKRKALLDARQGSLGSMGLSELVQVHFEIRELQAFLANIEAQESFGAMLGAA